MKIFYTDQFVLPLPEGHRFPMRKYARLRERVIASGIVPPHELVEPESASEGQLTAVHTVDYVHRVLNGELEYQEQRRIGFPWSPAMVERSRRSVGATIGAARAAFHDGFAVNLAGGTHHAYADRGEGYCVFNDVAVAIQTLRREKRIRRAVIFDCDVHQGNGTAALFNDDPDVFSFSVHGANNFPFRKERSTLDIALPDHSGDGPFLAAIREGLDSAFAAGSYDLAFYIAGADAHEGDRLGRLNVTREALAERDRTVLEMCARLSVPVVVVMGGGYGKEIEETVSIHLNSVLTAASLAATWPTRTIL